MTLLEILIISFGLAMDAFAVSICSGTKKSIRGLRPTFRLSFHFGLFQFIMPVLGWFLGFKLQEYIIAYDHWIALFLLSFVGIRMIKAGFEKEEADTGINPSKGLNLIILSIATSIDALAIGLSFAMLDVSVWYPAVIIGIVTALLSVIGVQLGNKLGTQFGKKMEIIGGLILIIIGGKILVEHLFSI